MQSRDGESQRPGGSKLARAAFFVARTRMAISRSGYGQTGCSAPERQQNFWSNRHATLDSAPALSTGPTASTDAPISGESVLTPQPAGHMQSPSHSCGIGGCIAGQLPVAFLDRREGFGGRTRSRVMSAVRSGGDRNHCCC